MLKSIKDFIRSCRIVLLQKYYSLCAQQLLLTSSKRILIIAPHPDDEILGCGNLIQKCLNEHIDTYLVFLTQGEHSHNNCCKTNKNEIKEKRKGLALTINKSLGLSCDKISFLDFVDGKVNITSPETKKLLNVIEYIQPTDVFIPHEKEGWNDHVVVKQLLQNKDYPSTYAIYEYCVWFWYYNSWILANNSLYVVSGAHSEVIKKSECIYKYTSSLAPCGKPWSGVLPSILLHACAWNKEIFFRIR